MESIGPNDTPHLRPCQSEGNHPDWIGIRGVPDGRVTERWGLMMREKGKDLELLLGEATGRSELKVLCSPSLSEISGNEQI